MGLLEAACRGAPVPEHGEVREADPWRKVLGDELKVARGSEREDARGRTGGEARGNNAGLAVVANSDIYFDETLTYLKRVRVQN